MRYSPADIESIQARWKLRFPPDLVELMRHRRPLIRGGFDWLTASPAEIRQTLDWPFEGVLFDVEENDFWRPAWGSRPRSKQERRAKLEDAFANAPKLIPLFGHRYLPATPLERGNPVFSVYQTDIIYYGLDLADWIVREEQGWQAGGPIDAARPPKVIPFWSEFCE